MMPPLLPTSPSISKGALISRADVDHLHDTAADGRWQGGREDFDAISVCVVGTAINRSVRSQDRRKRQQVRRRFRSRHL